MNERLAKRHNWQRVIIWGASLSGEACLTMLRQEGIQVRHFVDRYPPADTQFHGYEVVASERFLSDPGLAAAADVVIFAMGADTRPMKEALRANGFGGLFAAFRLGMSAGELLNQGMRRIPARLFDESDTTHDAPLFAELLRHANGQPIIAYGAGEVLRRATARLPEIARQIVCIVDDASQIHGQVIAGHAIQSPCAIPAIADAIVWITPTSYLRRLDIRHRAESLWPQARLLDWDDIVSTLPDDLIPARAWVDSEFSIYPLAIPPIRFDAGLDMILLDLPARFLGMLPNGLGYVHKILQASGCRFQTVDMDMVFYHRYHASRILDGKSEHRLKDGRILPTDPWAIDAVEDFWSDPLAVEFFRPEIDRLIDSLVAASPRLLGLSLHGTNLALAREVVAALRKRSPRTQVIVGGYDCINPEVGPRIFKDFDYMVIFEAESSLGPLIQKLLAGETEVKLPGVIANTRHSDVFGYAFAPAALVEDLDSLGYPTYDWTDISLYRNYNGYQLVPIVLSRGCRWSRCTFCGERFHWRCRSPESVVEEIAWLASKGCRTFHFNDSDLSGDPQSVRKVCELIIARGIRGISMAGQLRVQKGYTQEYFDILREAGFHYLRYGIDGWSKNTLKLHKKGYTLGMIEEVLSYTRRAGMLVAMNLVIGIPHETEDDIDETIENMIRNRDYYDTIENLNTLLLTAGSIYWENPEQYGIRFREDRESLYRRNPKVIPNELWYSVDPYIDQDVRVSRLRRILDAASAHSVRIGSYADWRVGKLKEAV